MTTTGDELRRGGLGIRARLLSGSELPVDDGARILREMAIGLAGEHGRLGESAEQRRADVRAFGTFASQLFTGEPSTPAGEWPASVPSELARLVARCLDDPDATAPTSRDIVRALDEIFPPEPQPFSLLEGLKSDTIEERQHYFKVRGILMLLGVIVLAIVGGFVAWRFSGTSSSTAASAPTATAKSEAPTLSLAQPIALWSAGQRDSARSLVRNAVSADSMSAATLSNAWTFAQHAGFPLDARRYCALLARLHAAERCEALEELDIRRPDRALVVLAAAAKDSGLRNTAAQLDYVDALATAGKTAEARALVDSVDKQALLPGRYMREDQIALMHGLVGDPNGAMHWFDAALASGSPGIDRLYWETLNNPIRKDPRLAAFAGRAGLPKPPPYWP